MEYRKLFELRNVLVALILLLLPAVHVFAADEVKIQFNYPDDVVYADAMNRLEIWIENPVPLMSLSLGFFFTSDIVPFGFVSPYGDFPQSQPHYIKMEDPGSAGSWHFSGWLFDTSILPQYFLMQGYASNAETGFPMHDNSTRTLSLKLDAAQLAPGGQFCIDNVFIPPAGFWLFTSECGEIPPIFYDEEEPNPEVPAVCFPVVARYWIKGDADGSGVVDISDVVFCVQYIFAGGPAPAPLQSADVNRDFATTISDCTYLVNYISAGGPAPC